MSECSVVTSPLTRSLALVCASAGCVFMLISCSTGTATPRAEAALVERSQVSMGTEIHLSAWTTDEAAAVAAFERVFRRVRSARCVDERVEGRAATSCASTPRRESPPSPSARKSERCSTRRQQVSEWTGGQVRRHVRRAVGPLEVRSGHRRSRAGSRRRSLRDLPLIDYRALEIDDRAGTAFTRARRACRCISAESARATPSIARSTILRGRGLTRLHDSGRRRSLRRRPSRRSAVASGHPRSARRRRTRSFAAIELTDAAFSTSGDYERFFMQRRPALPPHPRSRHR